MWPSVSSRRAHDALAFRDLRLFRDPAADRVQRDHRAGFMLFGDYVPLSDNVRRALRYAPAPRPSWCPTCCPGRQGWGRCSTTSWWRACWRCWCSCARAAVLVIIVGMLVLWGCAGWQAEPTGRCPSDWRDFVHQMDVFADRIRPPRRFSGRFGHSATCFARAPGRLAKIRVIHSNPGLVLPISIETRMRRLARQDADRSRRLARRGIAWPRERGACSGCPDAYAPQCHALSFCSFHWSVSANPDD